MKKVLAALVAFVCVTGNMGILPESTYKVITPTVMTAVAAEEKDFFELPGRYAESYIYTYADTNVHSHSLSQVTLKETSGDGNSVDYSTWEDSSGNVYGVYEIKVTDKSGEKETLVATEYAVALVGIASTTLDVDLTTSITVPDKVISLLADSKGGVITDTSHCTVVGKGAVSGSYLKTINLEGVEYISDGAFQKCSYITEITIPASVKYVGANAFSNSGLKTLTVNNEMPVIPSGLCSGTKLTEITFAKPHLIRYIGKSAFASTPVDKTIFADWYGTDVSDYELLGIADSAYSGCSSLTEINISDNILRLGIGAFSGCTSVTDLVFGKNVLVADKNCFSGCSSLKNITFNDVLQSLGGGVFSKCTSLVSVPQMPNTLTDWVVIEGNTGRGFGNAMFSGCTSLKSVELPTSITQIPDSVFAGCTALNYVYNSDNITSIGESAFKGCTNLLEAVFPNVSVIEASAFSGCSSMKTFEVAKCTEVGDSALSGCSALTKITLIADVYGTSVFQNCTGATKITFNGAGMEKTPNNLFNGCTSLVTVDGDLSNVTIISTGTFAGCAALKTLDLPKLVIIESNAFKGCTSLTRICQGDIVAEDFGSSCFYGCTSLEQAVNSTASTIGSSAFQQSGITNLTLSGTVGTTMVLGSSSFANCENLKSVIIDADPAIKYSVGDSVFANCPELTSVKYSGNTIVDSMFSNCTNLATVQSDCTIIEDGAFKNCSALKSIKNTSGGYTEMTTIAGNAFTGCSSLVTTHAGAATAFTGKSQYENCTSLTEVNVSTLTQGMFTGCTGIAKANINGVIDIPASAFKNCSSLVDIDLTKVLTVGSSAFAGTGIKNLVIDNATEIDASAFVDCANLQTIDVAAATISDSAFAGCQFLETATVCAGTIGSKAFSNCGSLRRVNLQNSTGTTLADIGSSAFENCSVLFEIVVPGNPTMGRGSVGYVSGKVNPDFVLVGETGSTVEEYATKYGITFCDVNSFDLSEREQSRKTPGDVDGNGLVSVVDAVKLQSWLLAKDTPGIIGANMDLNGDSVVDALDMVSMRSKLAQ